MRGGPKRHLPVERRIIARGQIDELVVANGDVAAVPPAILPNTDDPSRIGGLRVQHADDIPHDYQAIEYSAAAGIRLHGDVGRIEQTRSRAICPPILASRSSIANPIAAELDGIVSDFLAGAETEVDADVLVWIGRNSHGIEIRGNPDMVVSDRRVVESGDSAGAVEHTDTKVEVHNSEIRDRPILVRTAIELQEALQVCLGQIAWSLDRCRSQVVGGQGDVVQAGWYVHFVVVDACRSTAIMPSANLRRRSPQQS